MKTLNLPVHKMKRAYKAACTKLGQLNRLSDSAYRTKTRSRTMSMMNRLRHAIKRTVGVYKGVQVSYTKTYGYHFIVNGVKSRGYVSIERLVMLIDVLIKNNVAKKEKTT